MVREQGHEVDDNKDPAPENIPVPGSESNQNASLYEGQRWGWDGIDRRTMATPSMEPPSFADDWTPVGKLYNEVFF